MPERYEALTVASNVLTDKPASRQAYQQLGVAGNLMDALELIKRQSLVSDALIRVTSPSMNGTIRVQDKGRRLADAQINGVVLQSRSALALLLTAKGATYDVLVAGSGSRISSGRRRGVEAVTMPAGHEVRRLGRPGVLDAEAASPCFRLMDNSRARPIKGWSDVREAQRSTATTTQKKPTYSQSFVGVIALTLAVSLWAIGQGASAWLNQQLQQASTGSAETPMPQKTPPVVTVTETDQEEENERNQATTTPEPPGKASVEPSHQASLCDPNPSDLQEGQRVIRSGEELLSVGRNKEAAELLVEGLRLRPTVFDLRLAAIKACIAAHQLQDAMHLCAESLPFTRNQKDLRSLATLLATIQSELDPHTAVTQNTGRGDRSLSITTPQ